MTELSFFDRAFRTYAAWVERPTLALVGPQPWLRQIFDLTGPLSAHVPDGTKIETSEDGTLTIMPQGIAPDAPLLMYFHGGGFTIGSPKTHAGLVAHLARYAGMRAVVPKYRLAPEHPYPAAQQDCFAAYEAALANGTPTAALCGDSAGGCLALQVAIHARDGGLPMPKALGLIAPIADFSGNMAGRFAGAAGEILIPEAWPRRLLNDVLDGQDPSDPAVSPLLGDLSGLPPAFIQAASGEVLAEDARRLVAAMDRAELDLWPGLQHVWQIHAGRAPAADRALAAIGAFLKARIPG